MTLQVNLGEFYLGVPESGREAKNHRQSQRLYIEEGEMEDMVPLESQVGVGQGS